jgi:hypothetical protein
VTLAKVATIDKHKSKLTESLRLPGIPDKEQKTFQLEDKTINPLVKLAKLRSFQFQIKDKCTITGMKKPPEPDSGFSPA